MKAHDRFLDALYATGYTRRDQDGMCHGGVFTMALLALCENIELFNRINSLLEKIPSENLQQEIEKAQAKLMALYEEGKQLSNYNQNQNWSLVQKFVYANKTIRLTQAEQDLLDMSSVFDNIEMLHHGYYYHPEYLSIERPTKQNAMQIIPQMMPDKLIHFGGLADLKKIYRSFNQAELQRFLFLMQNALEYPDPITYPFVLVIDHEFHTAALIYDINLHQWRLGEMNKLPINPLSLAEAKTEIFRSFAQKAEYVILTLNPLARKADQEDIQKRLSIFQNLQGEEISLEMALRRDGDGSSLFRVLVDNNEVDDVRHILQLRGSEPNKKVDPNQVTSHDPNECPLMIAIYNKNSEMVKVLLEAGANVNWPAPSNSVTPLIIAVTRNDIEITKILLDHGARINVLTIDGRSPLHASIFHENMSLLIINAAKTVNELEIQDAKGNTALHLAIDHNNYDAINALLDAGVDTEIKNTDGENPLHLAIKNNNLIAIKMVLSKTKPEMMITTEGGNFFNFSQALGVKKSIGKYDSKKEFSYTALQIAALIGDEGLLKKMLDSGPIKHALILDAIKIAKLTTNEKVVSVLQNHKLKLQNKFFKGQEASQIRSKNELVNDHEFGKRKKLRSKQ